MSDVRRTGDLVARGEQRRTGAAPLPDALPANAGRGQTAAVARGLPHGRETTRPGVIELIRPFLGLVRPAPLDKSTGDRRLPVSEAPWPRPVAPESSRSTTSGSTFVT